MHTIFVSDLTFDSFHVDWLCQQDLKRLLKEDDYVSRFFRHCADIPGDHLKNTMDMILRSFQWRKNKNVGGNKITMIKDEIFFLHIAFINK